MDANFQASALAAASRPDPREGVVRVADNAARRVEKFLTCNGRPRARGRALEQYHSKALLDVTKTAAEGRLANMERVCGPPQASMSRYDERPSEIAKLDRQGFGLRVMLTCRLA